MFKLYGDKQRCLWCGKSGKDDYKETTMTLKFANPPQETAMVCSSECEKNVADACKFIEKGILFYIVGATVGSLSAMAAVFNPITGKDLMPVTIIGLFILGFTVIITPFVTPQTIKWLGFKKGMLSGRICGFITVFIAVILLMKYIY